MCGDPWPISVSNTNLTSGTKSSLLSPSDRDRQSMNWPGLWLCSVVRSVFVQPIANYPLLIAENSDKISEERSQLWNSDRFFANNNKLIGTLLTFKEWKKNYPVRQANKIFLLPSFFLIIVIISWFPIPFPPSVTSCWFLINILVLYPCNVI